MTRPSQSKFDGIRALIDMFSEMESEQREKLLDKVRERDPDLFEKIDSELVTFDKILCQDVPVLMLIVQEVPVDVWALSLRGISEKQIQELFKAMPERKSAEILDEMNSVGPQPKRKVLEARTRIVRVARELERLKKFDLS